MFYPRIPNVMQGFSPVANLSKEVRRLFRNKNMSGIAAIHDPLGNVHASSSHIQIGIDVSNLIDRSRMNPHAEADCRNQPQCPANLDCTTKGCFGVNKEH